MTSLKRIKDLEDQIHALKQENESQKAQIIRYRERWQKLKETAKKKRSSRDAPEKIVEEDEGEVAVAPTTSIADVDP